MNLCHMIFIANVVFVKKKLMFNGNHLHVIICNIRDDLFHRFTLKRSFGGPRDIN